MRYRIYHVILTFMAALLPGVAIMFGGCEHRERASDDDSGAIEGAVLDSQLTEICLHRDWPALEVIVAPDYYGTGEGFEWDFAALRREFPKIQLSNLRVERQHVKRLAPDLILVNNISTIRETFGGRTSPGAIGTATFGCGAKDAGCYSSSKRFP